MLNRAQRRKCTRDVAKGASIIARSCLDYDSGAVSGQLALAALTRAIKCYAATGLTGDPSVIELSRRELEDFPTVSEQPPAGSRHWLAVGLAVDGRVAWKTASIAFPDIDNPLQQKLYAIRLMAARLQPELDREGVPDP